MIIHKIPSLSKIFRIVLAVIVFSFCLPMQAKQQTSLFGGSFKSNNKMLNTAYEKAAEWLRKNPQICCTTSAFQLLAADSAYATFVNKHRGKTKISAKVAADFNSQFLFVKHGTSLRHNHVLYPDSIFYADNTVLANTLPLAIGIVPDKYKDEDVRNIVKTLLADYPKLNECNVAGVPYLLRTLSDNDFADVAFFFASGEFAESLDKSDLAIWCQQYLGGIRNAAGCTNYSHTIIAPHFEIQDIDTVDASVETTFGAIRSSWTKTLEYLCWNVEIPKGITADVCLPDGKTKTVSAGKHHFECNYICADNRVLENEFVYAQTDFPQCHASSIVELKNGDLVATYFGGTKERNPDVCIWVNRKPKGSRSWSKPVLVADGVFRLGTPDAVVAGIDTTCARAETGPIVGINKTWQEAKLNVSHEGFYRKACWNPVLFEMPNGELWLFFKIGLVMNDWTGWVVKSRDGGITWSEKEPLEKGFLGPIKNKPVIVGDRLICPSSTENEGGWKFHFEILDLKTNKWKYVGPIERELHPLTTDMASDGSLRTDNPEKYKLHPIYCIQPSILKLADGRLQAIGRTRNGRLASTWSSDNGDTWTKVTLIDAPNNQSGTDAVTLSNGKHVLIYNNFATIPGTPKGPRNPLSIAISNDGLNWQHLITLEDCPIGDYSYPAIIEGRDGTLHCVYTWRRFRIAYKKISLNSNCQTK